MKHFVRAVIFVVIAAFISLQIFCIASECETNGFQEVFSREAVMPVELMADDLCSGCLPSAELEIDSAEYYTGEAYEAAGAVQIAIGADAAWNHLDVNGSYDCRGDGVTVAIIDTGVYSHPDLNSEKILPTDSNYSGYSIWHGTFVAGIIAAQLNGADTDGIAPNVNILSLRIADSQGNMKMEDIVKAIDYAVACGADVINLSFGTRASIARLEQACRRADEAGVIVVSCVGNAKSEADAVKKYYPAAYDSVICVSSCDITPSGMAFSKFSCHNETVDVCAPGGNITSLFIGGGTAVKEGTSFAAPVVSAMAALAKQQDRNIDSAGFRTLLEQTSTDCGEPGWDEYYGYGVVNVASFVRAIMKDGDSSSDGGHGMAGDSGRTLSENTVIFGDVSEGDFFFDAVKWAAENNVTKGTDETHFSPNSQCTRAQMVTFLYRAAGKPEIGVIACPFEDVDENAFYYDAVLWAYKNGITKGISDTEFGIDCIVSREQVVTLLWRFSFLNGCYPNNRELNAISKYIDKDEISDWAVDPFCWAVENGITSGAGDAVLSPHSDCLRGQIVTFLWRLMK